MRGREKFSKYKKLINILTRIYKLSSIKARKKKFLRARNSKGSLGIVKRYALLKSICKSCGDNVLISEGVYIFSPENLSVGNNVSIHPMCYIDATGGICIGNDVSIAHGTTIMSTSHKYDDVTIPIKDQGCDVGCVHIEDNVWIGAKATILMGRKLKEGCIVGANAVVTKDVENDCIVAGVPAKVVKKRI